MNSAMKFFLLCLLTLSVSNNAVASERFDKQYIKLYQCSHGSSNTTTMVEDFNIPNHLITTNKSTTFGLLTKCLVRHQNCHAETKCSKENLRISVKLGNEYSDTDDSFNQVQFTKRGYLKINNDQIKKEYFNRNEYCIEKLNKTHIDLSICLADCEKKRLCIPKCCSLEKVLNLDSSCQLTTRIEYWKPLVYQSQDVQICGEKRTNLRLHYRQHVPKCKQYITYSLKTYSESENRVNIEHRVRFRLLHDGSVILKELQAREWTRLKEGDFCLDGIQRTENGKLIQHGRNDQVLITCYPEGAEETNMTIPEDNVSKLNVTGVLYIFLLFSGVPFLLLTVIVYILLWQKQNVHGWTLFSHNLAMLLHYFCQGLTNTVSRVYNSEHNASVSCRLIGIANHFFSIAAFTWLTMINLDLYLTFRQLQNTVGQSKGVKRFILYTIFAWGLPLVPVVTGVILDSKYGLQGNDADCEVEVVAPLYGHRSCYIVEEARAYYLYYPMTGLMAINLGFATITIYHMYQHSQSTKSTLRSSSSKHRQSFKVLAKLFVVMGLVWMLEIVVWKLRTKDDTLPWYLIFPDVFNLFQAIAIFLLFTCKSKVVDQLCELYPRLGPFLKKIKLWPCYHKRAKGNTSLQVSVMSETVRKK